MKKMVIKLDLPDNQAKLKAEKDVSALPGINSACVDMKSKKLTVIGDADPVEVVIKLRKSWPTEIMSVRPVKEPEKEEEPKKEEPKQKEPKKEEIKKEEPKQKEPKKEEPKQRRPKEKEPMKEEPKQRRPEKKEPNPSQYEQIYDVVKAYKKYNPQMTYYYAQSIEEKSDACIIC